MMKTNRIDRAKCTPCVPAVEKLLFFRVLVCSRIWKGLCKRNRSWLRSWMDLWRRQCFLLLGPMSADFTLYIYRIRAAILILTRRQTIVPATVQETLFTGTLGLTFLHVFIRISHVLEQRSVVICEVCWKPPGNQLLIKLSLLFVIDYCARERSGILNVICLGKAWPTPSWS